MIKILLTILLAFAGLLGMLLLLLLIALLLPVRARIALREGIFFLWAGLGPFRLRLLPPKPKKEKKPRWNGKEREARESRRSVQPEERASGERPPAVQAEPEQEPVLPKPERRGRSKKKPKGGKKLDFEKIKLTAQQLTEYARLALDAMGQVRRRVVIRRLEVHAVVATGDAASTAVAFGSAAVALSLLEPMLEQKFRVKRRDIAVDCAFDRTESTVEFDVEISALVIRLLVLGLRVGLRFWKLYKKNQEKAVLL